MKTKHPSLIFRISYLSHLSSLNFKKMLTKHNVEGFEAFQSKAEELGKEDKPLYVYFSGSKTSDGKNQNYQSTENNLILKSCHFLGKSWCPDCVTAQPVVESTLEKEVKVPTNYLYVGVGDRSFWKDQSCIFRTSPLTKLKSVPTLFKWGCMENRLEEDKLFKPDMITMLLED